MKTILFLHGWGGDENSFANILPFFSKYFNCLTPSLPMFQKDQDSPDTPWTLDNYADYVEKYLDSHNVEKCHIMAHSFGARVTTILVTRNPDRFERIVLTGAAGIRRRKLSTFIKIKFYKLKRKLGFKQKSGGSSDYQKLTNIGRKTFQNIINRDLRPEIKQITNHTLLIFGKKDTSTPVKLGKKWAKLSPNAKLLIYKQRGHFAFIDETSRFIKDSHKFLSD